MKRATAHEAEVEPATERRNIDDLRPHERQSAYFDDLSEAELQRLAESIDRNGLETPVQITTDNRIIKGHQRVRACKLLGWTEIDVRVRSDLDGNEEQIEYELLSDNLDRRQMTPIEIARCYRRLKTIEQQKSDGKRKAAGTGNLRDVIGRKFEMSGRNLELLEKILDTPEEVQQSVARRLLPVSAARRIARLPAEQQQTLANDIADWMESDGMDENRLAHAIKRLVKEQLSKAARESPNFKSKPGVLTNAATLETTLAKLERVLDKRPELRAHVSLPSLKQAHGILGRVIEKSESPAAD